LEDQLFAATFDLDQLNRKLIKNFPQYRILRNKLDYKSVGEVQARLGENEALIEYFMGTERCYIFLLTKDSFEVFSKPKPRTLTNNIRTLTIAINKYQNPEFITQAHSIYKLLMKDVISRLPEQVSTLRIIPDGELSSISFDYLITNPSQVENIEKANFLIEDYTIQYHYSASVLKNVEGHPKPETILIAAPVFENNEDLAPLVMSEKEALRINQLARVEGLNTTLLLKSQATKPALLSNTSEKDIIHIASHSEVNKKNNDFSRIFFSPATEGEIGELNLAETYNLDMNPRLVTLSSCESGLGNIVKGEGMMSFTRGFSYSGAGNVIYSLWKVNDRYTSETMIKLYQNAFKGENYSDALRNAKLELLRNNKALYPKDWAGFVILSNEL
ncbi:MAG: CHAT domain-containing protein, partial [Cyclobacteriaceae bacterium]